MHEPMETKVSLPHAKAANGANKKLKASREADEGSEGGENNNAFFPSLTSRDTSEYKKTEHARRAMFRLVSSRDKTYGANNGTGSLHAL